MPRSQKETTFQGQLYMNKDRAGNRERVASVADMSAIWADSAVTAATTVAELRTAIIAAIAAQQAQGS